MSACVENRSPVMLRSDVAPEASDAYVSAHPASTSYHRQAWLGVIERAFGHETRYLVANTPSGIAGVLPLVFFRSRIFGTFTVSMPFLNYGGVLADSPEVERLLLGGAIEATQARGGAHLELRHQGQHYVELSPKRHKVAMELGLESEVDRQWQKLDRKVRNQVRKGEKSALEACAGGAELLPEFYEVFARNMRDLGTPVYGRRFFEEVLQTFPEESRVFVVRTGGGPVAASIVHWFQDRIEVPWASSLRAFNPLCANIFLYWEMLKFAVQRGFRTFDFGRSTPGESTYQFKKQWGAEPHISFGNTGQRPGGRCRTSIPAIRSSTSPSVRGSDCRCGSRRQSVHSSSEISRSHSRRSCS